jgi:8-oxo-dGTP diphosphatase
MSHLEELQLRLVQAAKDSGIDRLVVGAVIFNQESQVLVLTRQPDDFMGGIEELPSGKVEQDETLLEALLREVKEEAGLDIKVVAYSDYFDYASKSGRMTRQFNFVARPCDSLQEVKLDPEEHDSFRWISLAESFAASKITPPVQKAIESALSHLNQ